MRRVPHLPKIHPHGELNAKLFGRFLQHGEMVAASRCRSIKSHASRFDILNKSLSHQFTLRMGFEVVFFIKK